MNKEELLVSLCQEAIRIPSMSGHEKEVAGLLKKTMIDYGFDEVNIDKYGSVLGIIHGSRPGKTVLMDGHIDTVDVIDRDQWSHDPFAAEIDDGRIYGRSAAAFPLSAAHFVAPGRDFQSGTAEASADRRNHPGRSRGCITGGPFPAPDPLAFHPGHQAAV